LGGPGDAGAIRVTDVHQAASFGEVTPDRTGPTYGQLMTLTVQKRALVIKQLTIDHIDTNRPEWMKRWMCFVLRTTT
jgi:hypothetical protein